MVQAGQLVRQDFGSREVENKAETASSAVAAREEAAVQARFIMAMRNPRSVERFRVDLLKECKRPGFAELAEYERPVGKEKNEETGKWEEKYARGPSVHLIRTALALYSNVLVDSATIYENADTRIVHAYVLDLERNVSWARSVVVSKVVERRGYGPKNEPPKGRTIVGERPNSNGDMTYLVLATDDETRTKEANLIAKAQRENGRSILPRDIIDEAIRVANATLDSKDAEDPDAAARKVIDLFVQEAKIKPEELGEYLGHSLERVTPAELKELRRVFVAIREGNATWEEVMMAKNPAGSKEAAAEVARQKLANLGNKKETSKPKAEDGGARTTGPVATEPVTGKTDSGDRNDRETPAATNPGLPPHQAAVQQYRSEIGDQAFMRILGSNGVESVADVTEKNWKTIAQECDDELKTQREEKAKQAEEEPAKTQRRLKL
jgi:hypothetical protein